MVFNRWLRQSNQRDEKTTNCFDQDTHHARPRILFIGYPESSHTHSWIGLLENMAFNVRLFAMPSAEPPESWPIKTYLTRQGAQIVNTDTRVTVFPPPPLPPPPSSIFKRLLLAIKRVLIRKIYKVNPLYKEKIESGVHLVERVGFGVYATSIEGALAKVINEWKPEIIHTLGFNAASYLYLRTRKQFNLQSMGRWVAQARGGPDLALQRYSPEYKPLIEEVLATCDHFIADNEPNYDYALTAGVTKEKITQPGVGVVSGAGGIDVDALRTMWTLPPSKRERVIVWPKAYETYTAKAMPVFEAILSVWDRIQPCRIEMLWMVQSETKIWYEKLFPPHIKENCMIFDRITRDETLEKISKARVMIAPSLSDGIPNTMMESMALGAAPLVSPLDTIVPVVKNGENVLFARNLYPNEIGEAIVQLMNDDDLVDTIAENNLIRVQEMADRKIVKEKISEFYEEVARLALANFDKEL